MDRETLTAAIAMRDSRFHRAHGLWALALRVASLPPGADTDGCGFRTAASATMTAVLPAPLQDEDDGIVRDRIRLGPLLDHHLEQP